MDAHLLTLHDMLLKIEVNVFHFFSWNIIIISHWDKKQVLVAIFPNKEVCLIQVRLNVK